MTPKAQRIAIAEACGWKRIKHSDMQSFGYIGLEHECSSVWKAIPDYLNDLNAMHEAEKVMTKDQEESWRYYLEDACHTMGGMLHATAAQRAEAFLKCLGLWKE